MADDDSQARADVALTRLTPVCPRCFTPLPFWPGGADPTAPVATRCVGQTGAVRCEWVGVAQWYAKQDLDD